jgi:hypothetical protein
MQKPLTTAKNNPNTPFTFEVKEWRFKGIEKLETCAIELRETPVVIFDLRGHLE